MISNRISAVLLAAGGSNRLGRPKQLLLFKNDLLINHIVAQIKEGGIIDIFIVLGSQFDQIKSAISHKDVKIIYNPLWEQGVSTSIKAGLEKIDTNTESLVFFVVDQPFLESGIIKKVVEKSFNSEKLIIAVEVEGNLVHPVLFRKELFPDLSRLQGDVGGKAIMKDRSIIDTVICNNRRLIEDIDSEEAYESLIENENI
jgi:molybdenum cofactor cytidylyltransferase